MVVSRQVVETVGKICLPVVVVGVVEGGGESRRVESVVGDRNSGSGEVGSMHGRLRRGRQGGRWEGGR